MMEVDARMHVDEINEAFDAALAESDRYESIGGLLTAELDAFRTKRNNQPRQP